MPIEIQLPRLGWSMEEGIFVDWLKADGEAVREGEPLFVVEGDKAAQEVESIGSGRLHRSPEGPRPGEVAAVGRVLGWLLAPGETAPSAGSGTPSPAATSSIPAPHSSHAAPDLPRASNSAAPASPRARRAAKALSIDLATAQPGGRSGRIRERDVLAASKSGAADSAPKIPAGMRVIPVSPLRRTIANRLVASRRETVPVTLTCRCDATELVALRARLKSSLSSGEAPGITDILVQRTAQALSRHPLLAGRWEEDRILVPKDIHMGLAVDTDSGLLVPVIRHADTAGLDEIAAQSRRLIAAHRSRSSGGCFHHHHAPGPGDRRVPLSGDQSADPAILGVGAIRRDVVARSDGQFEARDLMTLSLTFDHRVVDGAPAARFLQDLCRAIELPAIKGG